MMYGTGGEVEQRLVDAPPVPPLMISGDSDCNCIPDQKGDVLMSFEDCLIKSAMKMHELSKVLLKMNRDFDNICVCLRWIGALYAVKDSDPQTHDKVTEDVKKRRSDQSDVPLGLRQEVETLYKLTMPDDFYQFWTFCAGISPDEPCDALNSSLGLQLVGPYDILSRKHKEAKSAINYNLHWRYFYDPPEFQTIIVGDSKTQYHIGYYRDSPEELPAFLGSNDAVKGCLITATGDNVFSAVNQFAVKKLKEISDKKAAKLVKDLVEKLIAAASDLGYSLEQKTASMKQRDKKVVTKSFHGAGLVVPVDKKTDVGYRELSETDGNLKKICKAIVEASDDEKRMKAFAPIQEMITFVQFANDECDYGMGYELGIDLFCYGSHYFHKVAGQLLPLAYKLLKRDLFAEIIETHLANRSKENVNRLAT